MYTAISDTCRCLNIPVILKPPRGSLPTPPTEPSKFPISIWQNIVPSVFVELENPWAQKPVHSPNKIWDSRMGSGKDSSSSAAVWIPSKLPEPKPNISIRVRAEVSPCDVSCPSSSKSSSKSITGRSRCRHVIVSWRCAHILAKTVVELQRLAYESKKKNIQELVTHQTICIFP